MSGLQPHDIVQSEGLLNTAPCSTAAAKTGRIECPWEMSGLCRSQVQQKSVDGPNPAQSVFLNHPCHPL